MRQCPKHGLAIPPGATCIVCRREARTGFPRYCRAAKAWLTNHHQPYFERDIELDAEANTRMRALNPKGGVPTINVEDEILVGFDARMLDRAIDGAARRRIASARVP